jgi:hypothetical protein
MLGSSTLLGGAFFVEEILTLQGRGLEGGNVGFLKNRVILKLH